MLPPDLGAKVRFPPILRKNSVLRTQKVVC
jgi:hypothetical protein